MSAWHFYRYQYALLFHLVILYGCTEVHNAGASAEVAPGVGGPNVCRSRQRDYCCPGWKLRPGSNLCVLPVCFRQCGEGKCVKPNVCLCENGIVGVNCTGKVPPGSLAAGNTSTFSSCPLLCLNGGTCDNITRKCICKSGYMGENCAEPVCKENCLNGGRCIGPDRCACVYGFAGRKCEADYRVGPCFRKIVNDMCQSQLENVVCTKQLCCATIGRAWGHPCEHCPLQLDCPAGFLKNIHSGRCVDIDECEAIPDLCDGGKCLNTIGSFQCTCPAGRIRNQLTNVCEDENECKSNDGRNICLHGQCVNTDGSYFCVCNNGYIPSHDRKHCFDARQGKCYVTLDETKKCVETLPIRLSKMDCCCGKNMGKAWGNECDPCPASESEEFKILCIHGNTGGSNGTSIMLVDECALRPGVCGGGKCIDTPDSFVCDCYPGYQKQKSGDVQVCADIDECTRGLCKGGQCLNTPGSFQCTCPAGFHTSSDGKLCIDHDECAQNRMCANGICINVEGSFKCRCNAGYILSSTGHACVDVDECFENPRICLNGRCLNSPGGYHCECPSGFTTTSDGGFCVDIDECSANSALCDNGRCVNIDGSFRCLCNTGYHLSTNKTVCIDFDECINSPCYNGKCINTLGSFRCECPHGFFVGIDGRTCHDSTSDLCYAKYRDGKCLEPSTVAISKSSCCCAESNHTMGWGAECTPCPSTGSTKHSELCPHGAGMTFFGEDINECAQSPYICENGACENLMGTYRCICSKGYEPDKTGKVCVDINECNKPHLMCVGGRCKNIPGDYQCICPLGTHFNATTSVCEDTNECMDMDICKNGRCTNSYGSYTCECPPNTILDSSGRVCLDNRRGSCWTKITSGRCENNLPKLTLKNECCCSMGLAWGSPCEPCDTYQCNCTKGHAKLDGKICSDVNECDLNTNLCRGGGTCINTEGSYSCVCPPGLTLDFTGTICQDSRLDVCYADYKYGTGAGPLEGVFSKSTCCCSTIGKAWGSMWRNERCPDSTSSAFADLCPKGFGFIDRKDINECVEFPGICSNGRCKNVIGNFSCTCNPGFTHNENGLQCLDIDECNIVRGVCGEAGDCRNIPGSFECKCKQGFESHPTMRTCVDINECERTPNLCRAGNCVNDVGSYHCECQEGHELAPDRQSCKDIDECSRTSGICSNGICENMLGTFQCICAKGFQQKRMNEKSHCEDIDECSQNNGGCKDLCVNTPGSYHCDCAIGFSLLPDGYSCSDIDECAANPYICGGGDCINTIGRYTCVCGTGLLTGSNDSVCLDINECLTNHNLCGNGECVNTVGSFTCHCENGYSRKSEGNSSCFDDDECALNIHSCDKNAICINNPGSYSCRCLDGFNGNGFVCLDINECLTNGGGCHKNAKCINTDGSFKCVCEEGFHGDGFTCSDIDECVGNSIICENGYCVNNIGSYRCECNMGYMNPDDKHQKSCIDINECNMFKELCTFGKCVNMMGGFHCDCDPGYRPDGTGGNCTDVNECDSPQACLYGNCTNTEGSFSCACPPNYQLADSKNACIDRRESRCYMSVEDRGNKRRCSMDTGSVLTKATCCCTVGKAWGGRCEPCPTPESEEFKLLCPGGTGYRPNATTVILEDVNECTDHANLCKNGHCTNTFGSYMCNCLDGFKLDNTGAFCRDIDECVEVADICGIGFCINDEGSYHCICPDGFMGLPSGKECVDTRKEKCYLNYTMSMCSEPMSNPQSRMICCCSMGQAWGFPCLSCPVAGSKEYTQLCGSRPGQVTNPVTNTTEEIDECALMPQICAHGRCINTPGSFHCMCDPGYVYEDFSHQCIDENECLRTPNPCQGNSRCANNAGGYECQCPKGYKLGMQLNDCTDIDECSEQEGICMHGDCINLEGSFHCMCRSGYTLNTLRDRCVDFDECQHVSDVCRNGSCENVDGSYKCHCFDGFKLSHNNDCTDVDECTMMPHLCRNGRCLNTEGSFRCECAAGFTLTADGEHCTDIDECIEQGSSCLPPGQCQNVMGSYYCICPNGYRLTANKTFCEDVNECEFPGACRGGQCRNIDGGYNCICPEGYIINTAGTECIDTRRYNCYENFSQGRCSNPRYQAITKKECCCSQGLAWGHQCEKCPTLNTTEFQTLCPKGMGHNDVGEDLNECVLIPHICQGGECINTDGSFRCDCPGGFRLDSTGTKCVDDNECVSNPTICGNGNCSNLFGSFECICDVGFVPGPNQTCEDVNECSSDHTHQCAFRCHNTYGSYRCACPFGFQLTDDGKHCQDVNECSTPVNNCKYECRNTIGSFVCQCPAGFIATNSSKDECVDLNECLDLNICKDGRCVNLDGSYKCECDQGFKPSSNGKQCIDDKIGYCYPSNNILKGRCVHYNVSPKQITRAECCCTMGAAWGPYCDFCPQSSTQEYQKLCPSAGMNSTGNDIDECSTILGTCVNGRCLNTVGSYRCACNKGYKNDHSGTKCVDINECVVSPSVCQMTCENTDGGYNCGCIRGYTLNSDNSSCTDIDECVSGTHICQQICINTKGSYDCACNPGYRRVRNNCFDIDECAQGGVCPPPQTCTNTFGSYRCLCPRGMKLDSTNSCIVASDSTNGSNGSNGQNGNGSEGPGETGSNKQDGQGQTNSSQAGTTNTGETSQDSDHNNANNNGGPNHSGNSNTSYNETHNHGGGSHDQNSVGNQTLGPNEHSTQNHSQGPKGNHSDNSVVCQNGKCVSQRCPVGFTKHPNHNECVDNNECLQSPCGSSQCINTVGSYQCICADGFFYDDSVSDCVEMKGDCADSPCTSGCTLLGINDYVCGCPTGYQLIGPGHCFYTTLNSLPPLNQIPDLGNNILTYPINADSNSSDIISTEGCFSCKVNGMNPSSRSKRSEIPNGTSFWQPVNETNSDVRSIRRLHQWKRSQPHIKLVMTYEQIMKKAHVLNLQPSSRDSHSEYILADNDDARFFSLQKENHVWTLYFMAPEGKEELIIFHVEILDKMSQNSFELHLELAFVPGSTH